MNVANWNISTKNIFTGIIVVVIGGILSTIFGWIPALGLVFKIIFAIVTVVGYLLYFFGLGKLKNEAGLEPADASAVNKLWVSALLLAIGLLIGLIPIAGAIINGILALIAFILSMIAFNALRHSTTIPKISAEGANLLFITYILSIISGIFGFIPVAGAIISGIIGIVCFILMLIGWKKFCTPILP